MAQLDALYTGHDARARLIWNQVCRLVADPSRMRALAFCVGVNHARFMADFFAQAGIQSACVVGTTPQVERGAAVKKLQNGELQVICTVDVFNEGVDIPSVDTVLLLRPTESATVFLQQIGRGLRLSDNKECLTVLDFIGMANSNFRFDVLYRGLVGGSRRELAEQVEKGFPFLPSGCVIQLDRVAQSIILGNLERQLNRTQLVAELKAAGPQVGLAEFLDQTGEELGDIYRGKRPGWMALRRDAGFEPAVESAAETKLFKAVSRMLHLDSTEQLEFYERFLQGAEPQDERERRLAQMLRFSLWTGAEAAGHAAEELRELPAVREEFMQLLPVLRDRVEHLEYRVESHPEVPLAVHCHYSLAEICAAFGILNDQRLHVPREGVYYHEPSGCDLLFITIHKSERDYSPSTMYKDYAISPTLFHWQSQNATREDSPTGLRYRRHKLGGTQALLFVRERKESGGVTCPYLYLGPAGYVSHEGERPMAIVWELKWSIPVVFYRGMRVAA